MTAHAPAAVDDPPPTPAAPPAAGAWPSAGKAWWCVVMLSIVLMLSQIDRGIITLLVAPIKRDLHLSDVQISLLLGPAFILFYVFMGLPLSRLTDVRSRRVMIACGLTFWSVMTAMCGAAQGFWQLFWARVGIGAGESVNGPATYSMLADYFPRERLPRALAALNVGFIAGGGFSLVAGGLIIGGLSHVADVAVPWGVLHSWQLVFVVVGAPGLLFALLMMTVAEPARRGLMAGGPRPKAAPLREVVRYLVVNRRLYGCMIGAAAVSSLMAAGVQNWGPTFYQRTYGWAPSRIGVVQGTMALFVSPLGLIIGTWLCERLHRRRDDTNLLVVVIAYTIAIPFQVLGPLMPSAWLAIACSGVGGVCSMMGATPFVAALQSVTPNPMRAQISALYLFVFSAVGGGLGPLVIASLTDIVLPSENDIRYALSGAAVIMAPLAVLILTRALKPYGNAIARVKELEARQAA